MPDLVFVAVCIVGAFILAMRRAPLWAWTTGWRLRPTFGKRSILYGEAG